MKRVRSRSLVGKCTHVRKKVDALGRFCARMVGMDPGLLSKSVSELTIPEDRVTTKKECYVPVFDQ